MKYEVLLESLKEFVAENPEYIELNDDNPEDLQEDIQDIADNDGRCTCTDKAPPPCPCKIAGLVVQGVRAECLCGIFRRVRT